MTIKSFIDEAIEKLLCSDGLEAENANLAVENAELQASIVGLLEENRRLKFEKEVIEAALEDQSLINSELREAQEGFRFFDFVCLAALAISVGMNIKAWLVP